MTEEFYVGYVPKAPPSLARRTTRVAAGIVVASLALATALVVDQPRFGASRFEYGIHRDFAGVVKTWPYPMLATNSSRYILVAPGKHGLSVTNSLDGHSFRLQGSLIERGPDRMIEVVPGSLIPSLPVQDESTNVLDLGPVKLRGEIVDSKCYLGVMNPGQGKVHRDCAARCISGGIPPAFIVRDSSGTLKTLLLTASNSRALNQQVLPFVAEPLEISGELVQSGPALILKADPAHFRRVRGM